VPKVARRKNNPMTLELDSERESYNFFPDIGNIPIDSKASRNFFHDVISMESFQRLRNISFLGCADYITRINGKSIKHNRYHHCIGVGIIADYSMRYIKEFSENYNTIIFSALMHDIGHFPLSHTLESTIRNTFDIDHHSMTLDIIFGQRDKYSEIQDIISKYKINKLLLRKIMSGDLEIPLISSKKMNIDTFDAIPRSYQYFNNSKSVMDPYHLVDCFFSKNNQKSRMVLANFWNSKGDVYRSLLQSIDILASEILSREIFILHSQRFEESHLRLTDKKFLSIYPEIGILYNNVKNKKLVFNKSELLSDSELDITNFVDRKFITNDWNDHSDLSNAFEEIRQDAFVNINVNVMSSKREKKLL